MRRSRGRRAAAWAIALGFIIGAGGAFALWNDIIDQWHIWKLSHEDQAVRWEAARRLGERKAARAAPRLIAALRRDPPSSIDGSPVDRALVSIGASAVPALAAALEEKSPEIRRLAATRLGEIRARPDVAVPALTRALRFDDPEMLLCVLPSLSAYGRKARTAVPRLIKLLESRRSEEWLWVAGALWAIDRRHPALPAALEKGLEDDDPLVREVAAQYLQEVGER